ncbi:hypothetical protein MPNT_200043 [Candidatus Methylacidithermus pantelleriae]|uniref:Uncharacterized protein n=1 Tax=Candidatus Methylacidithermus pantelleriae TaxID=2744239 RepID=A0A8J2FSK1_9BACT|nr:hypothetical protein MPNT_200043 [Candidatus Methylacidithermus pantelleriae]
MYFEGQGRRDYPVMDRAEITDGIGGQFFFSIATHAQEVPISCKEFAGKPGGFENSCGVARDTPRPVGHPRKNPRF